MAGSIEVMIVRMNQRNKEDNFMYTRKQDKVIYSITAHEHKFVLWYSTVQKPCLKMLLK